LGWSLFNQDKAGDAIPHLKQAATVLPEATPSWRTALWHLGAALEQTDQKAEALNYYIKSYISGEPDPVRRRLIEQLYVKINGSMDGLEQRITSAASTPISSAVSEPASPAPAKGQPVGSTDSPSASASPEAQPASASATPSPEVVASPVTEKPAASSVATDSSSKPTPSPPEVSPTPSPAPTPTEEQAMAQAAARLRATIKITGRIADANNKGIENVVVVLISPRGTVLVATTDANGKYSFSVSPSQRNYRIVPSKEGYSFDPVDKTILAFSEDLKEIDFIAASRTP